MFTMKYPLLFLLLSSGAESKLGAGTGAEIKVRELEQIEAGEWFDWSNFTHEERYIVKSDSTLRAEMINPNHVGRFAAGVDTSSVNWDVVVVDSVLEINQIADEHTILERDNVRIPVSIKSEDVSEKEQRRLVQEVPWGISNIFGNNLPNWDAVVGTDRSADAIRVCIIDSGYYEDHQDLPVGEDATAGAGVEWKVDGCKHGSHVAGTMVAENNDNGVVGVFPGQKPLIVKVFSGQFCGWSWSSSLVVAMQHCQSSGAKVINMSLGGVSRSDFEQDAIDTMYEEGMLLVAAAGNGDSSAYLYPASYDNVVSVAAVDSDNNHAWFSQRNDQVDIAAPGVSVRSTNGVSNSITSKSGTSMASPHIAGMASLLWNEFPACTNTEIIAAMKEGAVDAGDEGYDHYYGHGIAKYYDSRDILAAGCGNLGPTTSPVPTKSPTTVEPTTSAAPTGQAQSFELNVTTDNYPAETSWILTKDGVDLYTSNAYTSPNTNYPYTAQLAHGDYELKFADTFGDGICCSYGQGYYEAKLKGVIVASGGQFGAEETKEFSVGNAPPTTSSPVSSPLPTLSPVSIPPTTSSPTSATSSSAQFWAVCPKRGECDVEDSVSETSKYHAVRCCSDSFILGWKKNNGCGVWGRALLDNTCALDESHAFAQGVCEAAEARLCTKEELVAECTADTECGADNSLAWSMTSAVQGPTSSPTSQTTGISTNVPTISPTLVVGTIGEQCEADTQGDSTDIQYWAACGRSDMCSDEPNGVFDYDAPHEVRCCRDESKEGWSKRAGCNVWTESKVDNQCYASKNFLEAECICDKRDGRLCTKDEIEGSCSQGTGCGFDNKVVWTSTKDITVSPSASPIVVTIDEECASETQGDSTSVKHWALCGSGGNCNNEPNGVFDYDTPHEVRCCSNVAIEGWFKRAGCNVWTESRYDGVCYGSKNFFEAECLCNKLDGRLCTKEEIEDSCSQGTGCGFDHQVVWTNTQEDP